MVNGNLVCQGCSIVTAQPRSAIRIDANAEIADTSLQVGISGDVLNGGVNVVVDLSGVRNSRVVLIVEGQEKDARDKRRR